MFGEFEAVLIESKLGTDRALTFFGQAKGPAQAGKPAADFAVSRTGSDKLTMLVALTVMRHHLLETVLELAQLAMTVWLTFGPGLRAPLTGRDSTTSRAEETIEEKKEIKGHLIKGSILKPTRGKAGAHCRLEVRVNRAAHLAHVPRRE